MAKRPYYESDDPAVVARGVGWRIGLLILGAVAAISAVSAVVWGVNAALAPAVGRVNQRVIINNPLNQIAQYQRFFTLDADIKTEQTQIRNAVTQLAAFDKDNPPGTADPTGQITQVRAQLQSAITGAAAICTDNVNKYNAAAQQYTTVNIQDKNLPATESLSTCEVPNA